MKSARIGGRKLAWKESEGEGRPALLLHGFPLSSAMWAPQFEAFGSSHRLIAPDLPGFGASEAPADPGSWRLRDYSLALRELLQHLGIERALIAGLSMGGYIALDLWRLEPSLFRGLLLVDTKASADDEAQRAARVAQQEEIRTGGKAALAQRLADGLLGSRALADPALRSEVRAICAPHPDAAFLAALEAMKGRPDSRPDLPTIDCPTWVVVGEEDRLTPPALSREMQEAIRAARLAVLPGAGHLSNFEEPAAFNEVFAEALGGGLI